MRIVDTSQLYALLVEDDAHHDEATRRMADGSPVLVPRLTMAELTLLATYRHGGAQARAWFAYLRDLEHVSIIDDAPPRRLFRFWESSKLSAPDCNAILVAQDLGIDLETFDDRQAAAFAS